jgi:hypothetical protein
MLIFALEGIVCSGEFRIHNPKVGGPAPLQPLPYFQWGDKSNRLTLAQRLLAVYRDVDYWVNFNSSNTQIVCFPAMKPTILSLLFLLALCLLQILTILVPGTFIEHHVTMRIDV